MYWKKSAILTLTEFLLKQIVVAFENKYDCGLILMLKLKELMIFHDLSVADA